MEEASRICLIYQVVLYHEDEDSEEYARTYYEALNQTLLTQKPFRPTMAHSGIVRQIQELFRHVEAYLELCLILPYLKLVYPEP